ncbi:MAG: glutamate--tRNA ligase [Thermotogaceae bacterium]|nr:glutamate--tRNA ligase [Thermotogaceae bacterium]
MVRVRFAPSPTGYLHVGGARTALYNFLFAKKEKGKFVLRIEDTDIERSKREYEERLIDAMKWLSLEWDEFYRQSERLQLYREVAQRLVDEGKAYYVYAYPEEIEKIREELLSQGKPPHYDQEILASFDTPQRRKEYEEKGLHPAIYFKMPDKEYSFNDAVKGEVVFKKGTIGDFAIMRSNGLPTYNFAVVVDDAYMEITHVIRGDDHLSNTLRQLAIYEALGKKPPVFAHVSMILGPDGSKLSKRHGATSVEEFRDRGYLPEALLNYLALLGWSHPEGKEVMTLEEMIENFSLDRLSKNPAIFDPKKLRWINSEHIKMLSNEELLNVAKPYFEKAGYTADDEKLIKILNAIKDRLHELSEIPELADYFFEKPDVDVTFEDNEKQALREIIENLNKIEWIRKDIVKAFSPRKKYKVKSKDFFHKLRVALTGKEQGVELDVLIEILGKEEFKKRVERYIN